MQDQATWYVSQDGHQIGPLTTDQIMAMAEQSQLRSEDHVWRPGFEDWQRAADVPGPIRPPPLPTPATSPPPLPARDTSPKIAEPEKDHSAVSFSPTWSAPSLGKGIVFVATLAAMAIGGTVAKDSVRWLIRGPAVSHPDVASPQKARANPNLIPPSGYCPLDQNLPGDTDLFKTISSSDNSLTQLRA